MVDSCPHTPRSMRRLWFLPRCMITFCLVGIPGNGSAVMNEVPWERLTTGMQVALWNPIEVCPQVPTLLMLHIDPEWFRFSIYQFRDEGPQYKKDGHRGQIHGEQTTDVAGQGNDARAVRVSGSEGDDWRVVPLPGADESSSPRTARRSTSGVKGFCRNVVRCGSMLLLTQISSR